MPLDLLVSTVALRLTGFEFWCPVQITDPISIAIEHCTCKQMRQVRSWQTCSEQKKKKDLIWLNALWLRDPRGSS